MFVSYLFLFSVKCFHFCGVNPEIGFLHLRKEVSAIEKEYRIERLKNHLILVRPKLPVCIYVVARGGNEKYTRTYCCKHPGQPKCGAEGIACRVNNVPETYQFNNEK
jgi:hypothetical protein